MMDQKNQNENNAKAQGKQQLKTLFWGGLAPVILFTLIEDQYGIIYGLVAGMIYAVLEILYEFYRYKKVSKLTIVSNTMILALGGVSLLTNEGAWFKLQPALLEFLFFIILFGSWLIKKPLLSKLAEQNNASLPEVIKSNMSAMTFRVSLFFLTHAVLAYYAAFYWTTEQWAWLKGVGLAVSFVIYLVFEMIYLRFKIKRSL